MDPSAVTIQESSEIAPTWAMLVGSMMMPEPIMFTATMNVSCTTFIFLAAGAVVPVFTVAAPRSPPDRVGEELDAVIDPLLIDALDLVVEAGKTIEPFLKRHEVVQHRMRPVVPALPRGWGWDRCSSHGRSFVPSNSPKSHPDLFAMRQA